MQPYFTLCVGAAASGTVYDDMSLLSRVVIDMTRVPAVRIWGVCWQAHANYFARCWG